VYLARLGEADNVVQDADVLYDALTNAGISVLYDDRDVRAGEKFADAELLGIPFRVVVSDKNAAERTYEVKARTAAETTQLSGDALLDKLSA
jgi:prolyl-tRNA synthetase